MAPSGFGPTRRGNGGPSWRSEPYAVSSVTQEFPIRPGATLCPFFAKTGRCDYGAACRFDHTTRALHVAPPSASPGELFTHGGFPIRSGAEECSFFQKSGNCKFGFACKFDHGWPILQAAVAAADSGVPATGDPAPAYTSGQLPVRPGVLKCKYFARFAACNYGMTCKWDHSTGLSGSVEPQAAADAHFPLGPTPPLNDSGLPLRPGVGSCQYYLKTGKCKYGVACKWDHSATVPIEEKSPEADVPTNLEGLPIRLGAADCKHYVMNGVCSYGPTCKYNHPDKGVGESEPELNSEGFPVRPGHEDCRFYVENGTCSFGAKCVKNHPEPSSTDLDLMDCSFNVDGLPVRQAMSACHTYISTGECAKGLLCRFNHPPDGPKLVDSVSDEGLPLRPAALNCSLWVRNGECGAGKRCPYNHPPREEAQRKGGKGLSPSGSKGRGKGGRVPTAVDLPTSLNSHGYPQRPGSKECVYFMKHGTCSYGANCVHHHPEMVASVPGFGPAAKLPRSGLASLGGGIGLRGGNGAAQPYPQRPGEIDCKYYLQHGTCSYRASCKFNHPPRA